MTHKPEKKKNIYSNNSRIRLDNSDLMFYIQRGLENVKLSLSLRRTTNNLLYLEKKQLYYNFLNLIEHLHHIHHTYIASYIWGVCRFVYYFKNMTSFN